MNSILSLPTQQESMRYRRYTTVSPNGFPPTGIGPSIPGVSFWLRGDAGIGVGHTGASIAQWADSAGVCTGAFTQSTSSLRWQNDPYTQTASIDGRTSVTPYMLVPGGSIPINRRSFSAVYIVALNQLGFPANLFLNKTASNDCNTAVTSAGQMWLVGSNGATSTLRPNTSDLCALGYVGASGGFTFWMNGQSDKRAALTAGVSLMTSIGGGPGATGFGMAVKDIMYFDYAITDSEWINVVLPYARSRGAKTEFATTLAVDGDSIAWGYGASMLSRSWANRISVSHRTRRANVAYNGQTASQMVTAGATRVDIYKGSTGASVLVVAGGTNDIFGGATDTTTYNSIVTYCQARQAAGWKVVVCTILPRQAFNATQETYRLSVNASIVSNWATFADAIVDNAADTRLQTASDTAVYLDGTHPTDVGYEYLRQNIEPAVKSLLGA